MLAFMVFPHPITIHHIGGIKLLGRKNNNCPLQLSKRWFQSDDAEIESFVSVLSNNQINIFKLKNTICEFFFF